MARYEWPPLPILDRDQASQRLADAMQQAWNDLEDERIRVLESPTMGRKALVNEWLREFQAAIEAFGVDVAFHLDRFLELHLQPAYLAGVVQGGGQAVWTLIHSKAYVSLATDTYADFLQRSEAAKRTSKAFAKKIRDTAVEELPKIAAGGRTSTQGGRRFADSLISKYDILHVSYADGTKVPVDVYTRMAARTKSVTAYNSATLLESREQGNYFMEVFDGSGCGWTSHGSPDKANGTLRHVDDCEANLLAHPNCQRAFGPRPDVRTISQAKKAGPTTTAEQRADQADVDWNPARQAMSGRARQSQRDRRQAARDRRAASLRQ